MMSQININQVKTILFGTELSSRHEDIYKVSYAVGDEDLGHQQSKKDIKSGFSFGIVQLDIGNNDYAIAAYTKILDEALRKQDITSEKYNSLIRYNSIQRPDLEAEFKDTYQDDRSYLNQNIFSQDYASNIIDDYTDQYLTDTLVDKVNDFLIAVQNKWSNETVFREGNSDYEVAISAMVSIANRTGGLIESTEYFLNNEPKELKDVKERFNSIKAFKEEEWRLIEQGATNLKTSSPFCFSAGTPITSADGRTVPIEEIEIGDEVLAFDSNTEKGKGKKIARRVTQTHRTEAQQLIDFHGLKVTPGHSFLTGEGDFKPLIEILETDGTVVLENSKEIRARTGMEVGTKDDQAIPVGFQDGDTIETIWMRAGTPYGSKDGKIYTIGGMMHSRGYHLRTDGYFVNAEGDVRTAFWDWGRPEDHRIAGMRASFEHLLEEFPAVKH